MPIETDAAKFDSIESKVVALTFPIKDIYSKIEVIEKANQSSKESLISSLADIDIRFGDVGQSFTNQEDLIKAL